MLPKHRLVQNGFVERFIDISYNTCCMNVLYFFKGLVFILCLYKSVV